MFYLYLVILSFIESYFFSCINQFFLMGSVILTDFIFSIICLIPAFIIVISSLHVKHLNNENLKKVGFGIIILGWFFFLFSCFSLKFTTILNGFETALIFSLAGYLVYYYQTVPEGEPDYEGEIEEESYNEYPEYPEEYFLSEFDEFPQEQHFDSVSKPEINLLKETLNSLIEIEDLDINLNKKLLNIQNQINQIDQANSEYNPETINDIVIIFQKLLDLLSNENSENDITNDIIQSFELISKNLENIYYNTRGAQVYRNQTDLNTLAQSLIN